MSFPLEVESSFTVKELKYKIFLEKGIPISKQKIIFRGRRLKNSKTLGHYNINKDSHIHVIMKIRKQEQTKNN